MYEIDLEYSFLLQFELKASKLKHAWRWVMNNAYLMKDKRYLISLAQYDQKHAFRKLTCVKAFYFLKWMFNVWSK